MEPYRTKLVLMRPNKLECLHLFSGQEPTFCAIVAFNEADTLESSSILIYYFKEHLALATVDKVTQIEMILKWQWQVRQGVQNY
jgi:hypothetical protein